MTYLNQGAEISIPSTYNENIFILPVTYIVIKKKNLLSFNGQYWNLSSFWLLHYLYEQIFLQCKNLQYTFKNF